MINTLQNYPWLSTGFAEGYSYIINPLVDAYQKLSGDTPDVAGAQADLEAAVEGLQRVANGTNIAGRNLMVGQTPASETCPPALTIDNELAVPKTIAEIIAG